MANISNIKLLNAENLFIENKYLIPNNQRDLVLDKENILNFLNDISCLHKEYYLGNLLVEKKSENLYKVTSGQENLIILYLVSNYFQNQGLDGNLLFLDKDSEFIKDGLACKEIAKSLKVISEYFSSNSKKKERIKENLLKVLIPVIETSSSDLKFNEPVDLSSIAKLKIMEKLSLNKDKEIGEMIWNACADMDSYVQTNINRYLDNIIFNNTWTGFNSSIKNFKNLKDSLYAGNKQNYSNTSVEGSNLKKVSLKENIEEKNKKFKFASIINFATFLLQVNKVVHCLDEKDNLLDNSNFLNIMKVNWQDEESAKDFLYNLLKLRYLFDKYIIKHKDVNDYKEAGLWSFEKIKDIKPPLLNSHNKAYKSSYKSQGHSYINLLTTLQSCLDVTYSKPKTSHWISVVLKALSKDVDADLLKILEDYAVKKVASLNYREVSGLSCNKIVFTYLDYILYRDGFFDNNQEVITCQPSNWKFQFRDEIVQFYPKSPLSANKDSLVPSKLKDSFGNIALITRFDNSKFSSLNAKNKIDTYPSIIDQSLKLQIMKYLHKTYDLPTETLINRHQDDMFKILDKEITKHL